MHVFGLILYWALTAFAGLLLFRLIMEYVFMFARSYRPAGAVAIALELCYTVTDPPLKALRRVIPPLRVGQVSVDLSFFVLFLVVAIVRSQVRNLG